MRIQSAIVMIRWIARAWSILSFTFVLGMVVGELLAPHAPMPSSLRDIAGFLCFPIGVSGGMILGWRWEGIGGGIAAGSLAAFYGILYLADGRFPRGPYFVLVAAPGFLFLLVWAVNYFYMPRHASQGKAFSASGRKS